MQRTKIVATIGPASESYEMIRELMLAGVDVFRLNFSHGSYSEHLPRIERVKQLRRELGVPAAIMLDTKGPEIRTGVFASDKVQLKAGDTFTLYCEDHVGDEHGVSVTYDRLYLKVHPGATILIDDGLVELRVESVEGTEVRCRIINGGVLSGKRGVNVPDVRLDLPYISNTDQSDIAFGVKNGIDYVAASFTRNADDIMAIRRHLASCGGEDVRIIAKIENREGVDNVDSIIRVADGIMVARGDLGVEIPIEEVPLVQKEIIAKCNAAGIVSITATQMLDSMIRNPRPTRAESNDVANAVIDGTDAVMLSGETTAGKYPLEAVKTMARIAQMAENSSAYAIANHQRNKRALLADSSVTEAAGHATYLVAQDINADAIVTATATGHTARVLAKYRPDVDIIAITTSERVYNRLALVWGVQPVMGHVFNSTDEMLDESENIALRAGLVREGDIIVVAAGIPVGTVGVTNLINIRNVGGLMASGRGNGMGGAVGSARVYRKRCDLVRLEESDVFVTKFLDDDMVGGIEKAGAVICESDGPFSAKVEEALRTKPAVIGAKNATQRVHEGIEVRVDAENGMVYNVKRK